MKISNKIMKIIYAISAIFILLITFIWTNSELFYSEAMEVEAQQFQTILLAISAGLGAFFLLYLGFLYKISTFTGKVWLLLGVGIATWAIGETIFLYYAGIPPFPSVADVFYVGGYLPLIAGLMIQMIILKIKLPIRDKVIIAIIYIAICVFVIVSVVVLPIQAVYPILEEEIFNYALAASYPILDLILLLSILVVFAKLRHGKINIAWSLLLAGFLINTVADIWFNWVEAFGMEKVLFELYDLMFLIGYVIILVGALSVISLMTTTFETP